ncbi:GNAT superfamily N-acetyltransferase [Pseudarthrobacter oxydans]|uniref:GNAT superfamily N-acetyltransferase n=2 Tax=Pseudarthrobacter oxydans TaxID=1671 RepID=A0AAW8N8T7_PSEOX|nr:GNAT family N-acetyltransferase [Pseudarthrobacter oxydans]MDR6791178.1 GNAT superfamily N-acetyltransferase [Pseudarthrobacter oxydans]MDR7162393.1 GNAT superfamily N-acetyltransferase [Pseudarthrobacter oxydans]
MADPESDTFPGTPTAPVITAVKVLPEPGMNAASAGPTADLRECQALRVEHELALWGNLDRCPTLQEAAEFWQGNEYEERQLFLARLKGETVGMCSVELPLRENTHTAGIDVLIAPVHRRRGLGRTLLLHAESIARERGRTSLYGYHEVPLAAADGNPLLPAKSGAGGLPVTEPAVAFAAGSGYELEQVERSSRLDLPVAPELLDRLESEAAAGAGGYIITGWDDTCPEDLVRAYAVLKARMSTDVPIAGMDWEGEDWDAARVREEEQTMARGGVQSAVTAALHSATGELVAYTVLNWRPGVPASIAQQDTLVTAKHRGRRLGTLIKVANLRRAQGRWPSARSVLTWNASENQHMLAINIALGFRPAGYEGEWQKRLG